MMSHRNSKKLKFLFLSADKFPPFRVDVSVLFGRKIVERGHTIDWLLQSEAPLGRGCQTQWSGCRAFVGATDNGTTMLSRARKHVYNFCHNLKLFELLPQNKYDIILVKDTFIFALLALLATKVFKTKLVYWLSYPFPEAWLYRFRERTARYPFIYYMRGHLFKVLLYQIILPLSDHIFVQSEQMQKDIASKGIPGQKMTAVPMGVLTNEIPFFGYEYRQKNERDDKVILYLGTLIKARKMDFLIRVFQEVLKKEPKARLYLVGGGEDPTDEQVLREEAEKRGVSGAVTITGFLPQKQAWTYVRAADVCISPFYPTPILNSTSPTKLIEYMAMGKAVVVNDHPEQRLVMAQSRAGVCVPYEEKAFAEAILHLLAHPEEASRMGSRGREYVEKYRNYDCLADLVEGTLLDVCRLGSK